MATMASANANTRSLAASARGRARADARRSAASRTRFAHRVRASAEPATELVPLEERLAIALKEDTSLPPNPNPLPPPPLPDLTELAEMAFLEVSEEELRDWTPKVHGVLRWMGALNEVDLAAAERSEELYRDTWRMPLRPDDVADFAARADMYAECKTWEKPYVKVPKVDKKEAAAEADGAADAADAASAVAELQIGGDDGERAAPTEDVLGMNLVVGRVLSVRKHPDAEKLYIEEVDCAEEGGPRTICSGLVPYMSASSIEGRNVVVVANLKPRNMAGVSSAGMLLCANDGGEGDERTVQLLTAPEGAVAGERLTWGTFANVEPHGANKVAKKKLWEKTQPDLIVNERNEATWKGIVLTSSAGPVTCASLKGGGIS
jgi:aminoacyl tRNA synthase complex-interacting multifunctional protein 1